MVTFDEEEITDEILQNRLNEFTGKIDDMAKLYKKAQFLEEKYKEVSKTKKPKDHRRSRRKLARAIVAVSIAVRNLGFTNTDDSGQEGLELAFDHWLAGENGAKRVIQDRYGRIVQNVESIRPARPGRDLVLSIDLRIQYLAYRELKAAIRDQRARAAGRRPRARRARFPVA